MGTRDKDAEKASEEGMEGQDVLHCVQYDSNMNLVLSGSAPFYRTATEVQHNKFFFCKVTANFPLNF